MASETVSLTREAGSFGTVGSLFRARARIQPDAIAVASGSREISFGALLDRVERTAALLASHGLARGDRLALLSRNRPEYLEVELAAGLLGVITACLNWRLAPAELAYCTELVSPKLVIGEADLLAGLPNAATGERQVLTFGEGYDSTLDRTAPMVSNAAEPEDGLVILYTSGTTGLPKGAVISHRAMIARALAFGAELPIDPAATFVAWAPMFHMVSTDHALATLMRGGTVVVIDGFQLDALLACIEHRRIGWLVLIPGMIDALLAAMTERRTVVRGISLCGAMADLVPAQTVADITGVLGAPYLNTFGSTETGLPPATRAWIPAGETPSRLSKQQSAFCEIKLVNPDDDEVPDGQPGELAMRGPTLFSGYWQADETNARDFRGGWFHMGDVFRRNADGTLDFVDRAKYMIKTGGENVYPAEIERVLLGDERIAEAAVVRAHDARWGEAPVAFVALRDGVVGESELRERCRAHLAGYKCPREIRFIAFDDFPRSTSGKVQRHELERRLAQDG